MPLWLVILSLYLRSAEFEDTIQGMQERGFREDAGCDADFDVCHGNHPQWELDGWYTHEYEEVEQDHD